MMAGGDPLDHMEWVEEDAGGVGAAAAAAPRNVPNPSRCTLALLVLLWCMPPPRGTMATRPGCRRRVHTSSLAVDVALVPPCSGGGGGSSAVGRAAGPCGLAGRKKLVTAAAGGVVVLAPCRVNPGCMAPPPTLSIPWDATALLLCRSEPGSSCGLSMAVLGVGDGTCSTNSSSHRNPVGGRETLIVQF